MAACYITSRIQFTTNYTPRKVHFAQIFLTAGIPDSGAPLPVMWEKKPSGIAEMLPLGS
jgi:hypothetical protein